MSANRNITRVERDNSGGYVVRIMRKGKRITKFFADSQWGGKRKALIAAKEHRDQLESTLKAYTPQQLSQQLRANNTSGVAGVRLVEEKDRRWPSAPVYQYWVAQWSPAPGVRRTQRFSVEKYGNDEAFRLAVKARKKGVQEMGK